MPADVFSALASPVRRSLLELLAEREPDAELYFLLKDCGLVHEQRTGRNRVYGLDARPLKQVAEWVHPFEQFWRQRLRALADLLDEDPR